MAKNFHGTGVEVGVEQGRFSEVICKTNPGVKLFCVDAWQPYSAYVDHRRVDKLERFYRRTRKLLASYDATLIRKWSMDAVKDFADCSLDFVYIDANHAYEFALQDIQEWSKKVKPGGFVAGHDYLKASSPEREKFFNVIRAVDEFLENLDVELSIYAGDEFPSWMYIKK